MNGARSFILILQIHHRGVDRATDHQRVPLRHSAGVFVAGPRFDLRLDLRAAGCGHGHQANVNLTEIALAEPFRRAVGGFNSFALVHQFSQIKPTSSINKLMNRMSFSSDSTKVAPRRSRALTKASIIRKARLVCARGTLTLNTLSLYGSFRQIFSRATSEIPS